MRQKGSDVGFIHASILQEAENAVCVADGSPNQQWAGAAGQEEINRGMQSAIRELASREAQVQPEGIVCEAQVFNAKLPGILHQNTENGGMKVKV